jgi:hypothetical protein
MILSGLKPISGHHIIMGRKTLKAFLDLYPIEHM